MCTPTPLLSSIHLRSWVGGVCVQPPYCVCGFCRVCGSVWEYMSVFLDMCTCCVAVLWFNKAFIYIAAMKSCHQVT